MERVLIPGDDGLDAEDEERRRLKRRVADLVRELAEATHLLDAAGVGTDDLAEVVAGLDAVRARVVRLPSHRRYGTVAVTGDWQGALHERSPISGRSNPVAPPLTLEVEGDRLRGHATYGDAYEGPPGHVHGGVVAGAFDEVAGVAQGLSGQAGFTGTLTITLRRPTPLRTRIDYEGGVDRLEDRKIFVWARSYAHGELLCEAEAVMVVPRGGMSADGRPPAESR